MAKKLRVNMFTLLPSQLDVRNSSRFYLEFRCYLGKISEMISFKAFLDTFQVSSGFWRTVSLNEVKNVACP